MGLSDRTLKALRDALDQGRFPDNKLPPERELAAMVGVSRGSVRKALAVLEAEGRIWRHVGRGTFLGPRIGEPQELPADLTASPRELMEVRRVLEPGAAALAALSATPEDIGQMWVYLDKSEEASDWRTYELFDAALHRAIADATHNGLMVRMLNQLSLLRQQSDWRRLREAVLTPERRRVSSAQHRRVVEAIAARDPAGASLAMSAHMDQVGQALSGGLVDPVTAAAVAVA